MVTFAVRLPIKKDDVAGAGRIAAGLPFVPVLKPLNARRAPGKPRKNIRVNIAALLGHPAHEASAPLDMACEAVPAPVGLPADIADLRSGNVNHGPVAGAVNAVKQGVPKADIFRLQQFVQKFLLLAVNPYCTAISSGVLWDTVICRIHSVHVSVCSFPSSSI